MGKGYLTLIEMGTEEKRRNAELERATRDRSDPSSQIGSAITDLCGNLKRWLEKGEKVWAFSPT
jgi:hypothetical protein